MERLQTITQYKSLMKEVRLTCKTPFSNNYYTPDYIQRFIEMERAYYHKTAGGVVFLFDEELYYKACLYLEGEQEFTLPVTDKKILVRNVYRMGKKEAVLPVIEKRLNELGFCRQGETAQVCARVQQVFDLSRRVEKHVKKMEQAGYHCVIGDESQIEAMEKMLLDSKIIKDYHIDYRTLEEKLDSKGAYMGIVDKEGKLCAASVVSIIHGMAQGVGIAIDERFKMHGLAPILAYYRFQWLLEQGVEYIQGWLLVNNEKSIQYHASLGYWTTDKRAEEWIRE